MSIIKKALAFGIAAIGVGIGVGIATGMSSMIEYFTKKGEIYHQERVMRARYQCAVELMNNRNEPLESATQHAFKLFEEKEN
ncbi:hypothetical protein [Pseudobutyrivibrio sp.]